ncbi:MAG: hypothetical protein ACO3SH_07840 [Candidatus Puniceispirillaceae bacterium]
MAERNFVHQPSDQQRGLEAAGRPYNPPLLPYEVALIEALGCSEQEYREFVRHAQLQAHVRPAEYDHIPDVENISATALAIASLILGLASTAVSILLAPKAPALESPAKIKGKKLADQIGPTRFNQTTSFDNVSSLAEYGQPIPIPFGKRGTGRDGALTGGLILAPALVWSRLYSYGSYQAYEGIYVAGQYGVDQPELGGIRVGTTALNSLGNRDFALYWSSQLGENRPGPGRRIAGTDEGAASGTIGRQVFTAPTENGQYSQDFSMAYNPQNNVQFGTSDPIHNGTAYRFNWEIISAPYSSTKGPNTDQYPNRVEVRSDTQAKRRKIAGSLADVLHDNNDERGMPGVGRAYSRRMGFISHSGTDNGAEISERRFVDVNVDDTLIFEINGNNWSELADREPDDPFGGGFKGTDVDLKDLKNSAQSWRRRAVDLLSIGSKWVVGASVWVVEKREIFNRDFGPKSTWTDSKIMHVTFRCVSIIGVAKVGIPGTRTIREPLGGYEGQEFNERKHCGAAFYNLCRLNMASIRPVRRDAEVIEIGIRSQVWNKASGLCDFTQIPSPKRLNQYDKNDITLTTPRMDKYFARTSCFSLWVRPVQQYGAAQSPWARIGVVFCVTGTAPVDQFNYIRIRPRIEGYYEYRFIPRTGSDIAINSIATNIAVRLDSQSGDEIGRDYTSSFVGGAAAYGDFRLTTHGEEVAIADIRVNEELLTDARDFFEDTITRTTIPNSLSQYAESSNTGSIYLIKHAWYTSLLGNAWDYPGQTRSADFPHYKANGDRYITIKILADSNPGTLGVTIGSKYVSASGSVYRWDNVRFQVVSATGTWATGDAFTVTRTVSGNPFANQEGYSTVSFAFSVSGVSEQVTGATNAYEGSSRVFEQNSQVADVSHYLELTKSNENGPEHEIVYVNECISNESLAEYYGMSTLGLTVKSSGQLGGIGQLRAWVPTGISVYRLIEQDNRPSNLFADLVYYLLTSKSQGVGNVVPAELIDIESLTVAAQFQRANRIFFDGVVEDSESFRSFLYDNAALQLCNFTIKNGRFGMMPALPYDSNYEISLSPIAVDQIFTAGNIIEDSLQVQYIDAAQRSNFRALVSWRVTIENDLPTQASALVDWADIPEGSRATTQQSFDLTDFCTNRAQALLTARFLLSVRRRITHTVSFKTVPDSLGIQPGSYIRVITAATSYNAAANGAIQDAGSLISISTVDDGTYTALIYNPSTSDVSEKQITISGGRVTDASVYNCLFTLLSTTVSKNVYQVEQLTLDEDGLVNVSAVEVPVDSSGASIVARDVLNDAAFRVLE